MTADEPPVFHVVPRGRLGNQMIQYMVALRFRELVPHCRISSVSIPGWHIFHEKIEPSPEAVQEDREQHVDIEGLAARMLTGEIREVTFSGYGQRLENFLEVNRYRSVFKPPLARSVGFGDDVLLCPVRSGDVMTGVPHYPLTPIEFYADVIAETGLEPVFMGETQPGPYVQRLRERFPKARFLKSQGAITDFEIIRQSKNIVVGVSTFIWLAAWLSNAEAIYMAVSGLFNPRQYPLADLLPLDDPRYRFYLFPINYGVEVSGHVEVHQRIAPYWRRMPAEILGRQLREAPRFKPTVEQLGRLLDADYYLARNHDVVIDGADRYGAALDHFKSIGFSEGRKPFPLDEAWYANQYPLAGFEVSQGDYADFVHHFAMVGIERGYRAVGMPTIVTS